MLSGIILEVLKLLDGLAQDIIDLLGFFNILNSEIERLVKVHSDNMDTMRDMQNDMNAGEEINRWDYKEFKRHIVSMKKVSLTVHSLSSLYTTAISQIINPGFSRAIEASHGDTSGQISSVVLANRHAEMNSYLASAEAACRAMSQEANRKLRGRLEEVDAATARESGNRRPWANTTRTSAPPPQQQYGNTNGRGFSRFNPFRR